MTKPTDEDDGFVLVLALFFLVSISIMVLAVASYALSGLQSNDQLRQLRDSRAAAEDATEKLINIVKTDGTQGLAGPCTTTENVTVGVGSARASCTGFVAPPLQRSFLVTASACTDSTCNALSETVLRVYVTVTDSFTSSGPQYGIGIKINDWVTVYGS